MRVEHRPVSVILEDLTEARIAREKADKRIRICVDQDLD